MITQNELHTYKTHRDTLKGKEDLMKVIKAKLNDMEDGLLKRFDTGEEVEEGIRSLRVYVTERRVVQWKAVVITLKGGAYAEELTQKTDPSVFRKLVVDISE